MFQLRKEHLAAFEKGAREEFEARVAAHVLRLHPELAETQSPEWLRNRVTAVVEMARRHGIAIESDVEDFARLRFEVGDDFDRPEKCPWVRDILNQPRKTGAEKVDALWAHWEAAADQEKDVEQEAAAEVPAAADEEVQP